MKKYLISLGLLLFIFSGCAGRQKQVCNQNSAYQHGYQASQKGDSENNASSFQGELCQDFDEYSTHLYKQDFKAGYEKGKKDYCSEFNFKKWGNEDGHLGKLNPPNIYSSDMKICLQDDRYKGKAEKIYTQSFNEAFCNKDRMIALGQEQAKEFTALNVPNIKKRCGSKTASQMTTAMREAYREQMKTNCTSAFWLLKGDSDAAAKKSKTSEIGKAQKCPSNVRDQLITSYSTAYNEKKALLLEEEKLAFEKQKQKEQMELEKQRQQQEYELEKERIKVVSDAINNSKTPSHERPYYFYYKGNKLSSRCVVDDRFHDGKVYVRNESNRFINVNGRWRITYYDHRGKYLKSKDEYEHLGLSSYEEEIFKDAFAPHQAHRCTARLNH